jgi:hypothetical protein
MPEEQVGAVYGSGDGSLTLINYAKEKAARHGVLKRPERLLFQHLHDAQPELHLCRQPGSPRVDGARPERRLIYPLSLPGVYRVSVNPGGSMALAFVQNSNYAYYPRKLTAAQTLAYSGGPAPGPRPRWTASRRMRPAGASSRRRAPTM